MTFNEYDRFTEQTDASSIMMAYTTLGLVGESAEALLKAAKIAEKVKKLWRNEEKTLGSQLNDDERTEFIKELGDILWYTSSMARRVGSDLETVAATNIAKLSDRKQRGVIKSEGDNR